MNFIKFITNVAHEINNKFIKDSNRNWTTVV